ncbi:MULTISPECIES: flagellar hook capping FlgD N-terminal domain-containing protein [Caldimonas]|jgi:flagellar basal-body rod modification protein FlgD|uniref:flagellar hook assembly protein FlgD n=1 Tax=Caldimonas TaxID=196013 RepID=UPI00035CC899|nr:flagellar hook capping FlgD N-terminal domain-containing protein [Caldimonas manganoxidans]MCX7660372.1 flagellar hook assembly protein FlgD [Caldimonas manganoxidans]
MDLSAINGTTKSSTSGISTSNDIGAQDRFLKLLVAQMQNQDPLNPLDNAQVTSQMAQIQTVTGIEKLNASLQTMAYSFTQAQALQGAALIGRDVLVAGNHMNIVDGEARAAFELHGDADLVNVEIIDASGQVIDRLSLGALGKGRHHFVWTPPQGTQPSQVSFKVSATSGKTTIQADTFARETVGAVSTTANGLELDLFSGATVPYNKVAAVVYH